MIVVVLFLEQPGFFRKGDDIGVYTERKVYTQKSPELPALRAEVREVAGERRHLFLLLRSPRVRSASRSRHSLAKPLGWVWMRLRLSLATQRLTGGHTVHSFRVPCFLS